MSRHRLILAALLVAVAAIVASPARTLAMQEHAPAAQAEHPPAGQAANAGKDEHAAAEAEGEGHDEGWMPTIAKIVNFVLLIGILAYFARAPLAAYLVGRIGKVREDLVTAAQTREAATRTLAEIDAKLKALPAEIEALRQRGAEDLMAERARIEEAAEAERQRLLEHTRREIDMRLRVAKRELLELTANLAVGIAAERIKRSVTPDDQARMVDRYAQQLSRSAGEVRQ